jgi:hypothetical protein
MTLVGPHAWCCWMKMTSNFLAWQSHTKFATTSGSIRVEAYITSLRSKKELLVAISEKQFSAEKDPRVKMMMARYVPRVQRSEKTKDDT